MRRFRATAYDGADCYARQQFRADDIDAARRIAVRLAQQFAGDLGDSYSRWVLYDRHGNDIDSGIARVG